MHILAPRMGRTMSLMQDRRSVNDASLVITHIAYTALKSDINVVPRGATFMSLLPAP
jgi:hypothetical protein